MKTITLDTGVEEFSFAGGGVLRFNPRDPNLYARFMEAEEELNALEADLSQQAKTCEDTAKAMQLLRQADGKVKELLNRVFGGGNDFHEALGGVSLLAVAGNGMMVVSNLMSALEEVLSAGAADFAREKAAQLKGD